MNLATISLTLNEPCLPNFLTTLAGTYQGLFEVIQIEPFDDPEMLIPP